MISKIELSKYRALGDKEADEIIDQIVEQNGIASLRQLMSFLSDYQNISFENQSPVLQSFLCSNALLPGFYDKKKLIRATDFYRENQQNIGFAPFPAFVKPKTDVTITFPVDKIAFYISLDPVFEAQYKEIFGHITTPSPKFILGK
jgi:hypothetical protein